MSTLKKRIFILIYAFVIMITTSIIFNHFGAWLGIFTFFAGLWIFIYLVTRKKEQK